MVKVWDKVTHSHFWDGEVIAETSTASWDIFILVCFDDNTKYMLCAESLKKISSRGTKRQPKRWEIVEASCHPYTWWDDVEYYGKINDVDVSHPFICIFTKADGERCADTYSEIKEIKRSKPEGIVLVPDNIKIEYESEATISSDWLSINKWNQSLYYSSHIGIYKVWAASKRHEVKCKLIPIDAKGLEVGGTYYHTDQIDNSNIDNLSLYCKYLWWWNYARWFDLWINVANKTWKYRYKVFPID